MIHSALRGAAALGTLLPLALQGAAPTVPVSPGSPGVVVTVDGRCPTFTWTAPAGSVGSELAIRPIDESGAASERYRRVEIPGDARSWTPSGEACLEPGETYDWRVRGAGEEWSEPLLLRVAGGPWLEALLEDLILKMLEERRRLEDPSSADRSAATPGPPDAGAPAHRSHPSGTVSLHVDGGDFYGLWAGGESHGIFAGASKEDGRAVYGLVTGAGDTPAVTGISNHGAGVAGRGETHGVQGISFDAAGIGAQGIAGASTGTARGVLGSSASDEGRGVTGLATATNGTNYGIFGASDSPNGFDFYAEGTGTYMPFTGAHETRLVGDPDAIRPGMVVSATGRAEVRRGPTGAVDLSSTLPSVEISRRAFDPAVLGVFVSEMDLPPDHWSDRNEDPGGSFAIVNARGEGRVWVCDANGPVAAGDYLTTSNVPGHSQRQGDGTRRAYTLGKATETVDWTSVTETVEHEGRTYRVKLIGVVYTSG